MSIIFVVYHEYADILCAIVEINYSFILVKQIVYISIKQIPM